MNRPELICQVRAEETADEAEILIYDAIGADWFGEGITSKAIIETLKDLKASRITVRINSGGGDVFEGNAIHNALKRHPAEIAVNIDSLAASAASVIAMAGDSISIAENAFLMIHRAWGVVIGNSEDMLNFAGTLEKVDGSLVGMYVARTGASEEQVREWMAGEGTWFNAEEAIDAKFVDEVTKPLKAAASVDISRYGKVPDLLRARIEEPAAPPEPVGPSEELVKLKAESVLTLHRTRM